jgi:hypothetical protein
VEDVSHTARDIEERIFGFAHEFDNEAANVVSGEQSIFPLGDFKLKLAGF